MSLPSPSLVVPTLSNDQAFFQGPAASGITFGPQTAFQLKKLEGLDKPNVRKNNMSRARVRGSLVGLNLLDTRLITFTLDVGPTTGTSYANTYAALTALTDVCSTEGTTEYPLWFQLPNAPLLCCMARVVKKAIPYDKVLDAGMMAQNVSLQFEATDPYIYAAPTLDPSCGLPTPGLGFTFNMTFPLSFGGGTSGNTVTATNNGDVPCYPQLIVTGPCVNPVIQNSSISGAPTLTFNISLNAGDQLVIDCDYQSVVYFPNGSSQGASYLQALQPNSTFFAINPGTNVISFNSSDLSPVAGTLTVGYSSTYDAAV